MLVNRNAICIAALTPARADEIRSAVTLRGMDQVACVPLESALPSLQNAPPELLVIDTDLAHADQVEALLPQLPEGVSALVICESFDEDFFLSCHDAGVRDFLVRPLADSYMLSRVLLALDAVRQKRLLTQHDDLLADLGVLSRESGIFTTSYFLRVLKDASEAGQKPGLLLLAFEAEEPLSPLAHRQVMQTIARHLGGACRGVDVSGEYLVDKFAVMLPNTAIAGVHSLAARLQQSLDGLSLDTASGPVTLKIRLGMAEYADCRHYEDLIDRALADLQAAPVGTL